jgi:hypothetical protein
MRTTVTLDPDTESLVRRLMAERGVSFKQALNDAIRAGAPEASRPTEFRTDVHHLGAPIVVLDKALQLAADLEDDELIRKLRSGK